MTQANHTHAESLMQPAHSFAADRAGLGPLAFPRERPVSHGHQLAGSRAGKHDGSQCLSEGRLRIRIIGRKAPPSTPRYGGRPGRGT